MLPDKGLYHMIMLLFLLSPKSRLDESGHIYESFYSGWYSVSDESFYSDWEIITPNQRTCGQGHSVPDRRATHVAKETGSPVEWMEERTYMFRLTDFKHRLHEWLDSGGTCLLKFMICFVNSAKIAVSQHADPCFVLAFKTYFGLHQVAHSDAIYRCMQF